MNTKEAFEQLREEYSTRIMTKYSADNQQEFERAGVLIAALDAVIESMSGE